MLLSVVAVAACSSPSSSPAPTKKASPPDATPSKEPPTMTITSWAEAEAFARTVAKGDPWKRSDALPYLFLMTDPPVVLIHQGEVITARGPAAAGAYLRDLGVIDGKGPGIEDVLHLLTALEALPPIQGVDKERYVLNDVEDQRDLTARIEHDGQAARVVLHYFLPGPPPDPSVAQGAPLGPGSRWVSRAILDIPRSGDAAWRTLETFQWTPPS